MFFKRFTFLVLFSTVFTFASAKKLDATFDLVRFKAAENKNMVELYCSVNGNSVVYKKVPNGFQASIALEVLISDSVGVRAAEKLLLKSPVVKDTAGLQAPFNVQKRFFLPNGNFKFTGKAQDVNSNQPASQIEAPLVANFKSDKVQFSDVQLLENYEKSAEKNEYTKSGYKLVSYVSNFFPKGLNKLKFYTELYNAEKIIGKDKQMVVFYRIVPSRDNLAKVTIASQKIMKTAPVNALITELDISTLNSGNYELVLEVRNEENQILAYQTRYIQRSNPQTATEQLAKNTNGNELPATFSTNLDTTNLKLYIRALRPIADAAEQGMLETVEKATTLQKQNYLYSFFKKRSETNPEHAWLEYLGYIEFVEKNYGCPGSPGYNSDMGRVYLQYGPPDLLSTERNDVNRPINNSDTKPYQIWQYYNLEKQRNGEFVFLQRNLGNCNYILVHSTAKGEVFDLAWRNQTQGISSRRGRANEGVQQYDRQGNPIQGAYDNKGRPIKDPIEPK